MNCLRNFRISKKSSSRGGGEKSLEKLGVDETSTIEPLITDVINESSGGSGDNQLEFKNEIKKIFKVDLFLFVCTF
jgi:hypothetical protein